MVKDISEKYDCSKAKAIRKAIRCQCTLDDIEIDMDTIITQIGLLKKRKNLFLPENLVSLLLSNEWKENETKNKISELGNYYSKELASMGINSLEEFLKFFESSNWYDLIKNSDSCYTLSLKKTEYEKFVKPFISGLLEKFSIAMTAKENFGKIRVKIE